MQILCKNSLTMQNFITICFKEIAYGRLEIYELTNSSVIRCFVYKEVNVFEYSKLQLLLVNPFLSHGFQQYFDTTFRKRALLKI